MCSVSRVQDLIALHNITQIRKWPLPFSTNNNSVTRLYSISKSKKSVKPKAIFLHIQKKSSYKANETICKLMKPKSIRAGVDYIQV